MGVPTIVFLEDYSVQEVPTLEFLEDYSVQKVPTVVFLEDYSVQQVRTVVFREDYSVQACISMDKRQVCAPKIVSAPRAGSRIEKSATLQYGAAASPSLPQTPSLSLKETI